MIDVALFLALFVYLGVIIGVMYFLAAVQDGGDRDGKPK